MIIGMQITKWDTYTNGVCMYALVLSLFRSVLFSAAASCVALMMEAQVSNALPSDFRVTRPANLYLLEFECWLETLIGCREAEFALVSKHSDVHCLVLRILNVSESCWWLLSFDRGSGCVTLLYILCRWVYAFKVLVCTVWHCSPNSVYAAQQ